jgi:hypothetical protein
MDITESLRSATLPYRNLPRLWTTIRLRAGSVAGQIRHVKVATFGLTRVAFMLAGAIARTGLFDLRLRSAATTRLLFLEQLLGKNFGEL